MKHRILALFLSVALLFSAAPAAFAAYTPEEQLDILLELSELIRTEGLESSLEDDPLAGALLKQLTEDPTLFEKLMDGMLSSYDEHTMYLPAGSYSSAFVPDTSYVGIGVTIQHHPKGALVTDVNLSGAAHAAGIKMGDILTEAAGQPLAGLTVDEVAALLRGEPNTTVTVTVLRNDAPLTFTLTRTPLVQLAYSGSHIADGTYYMKWSSIHDDGSYALFRQGLAEMQTLGDTALILDLRDNTGGSLDLAFTIVSDFIEKAGPFFRIAYRDPLEKTHLAYKYITAEGDGVTIPHIYVLVNGATASSAEVIAVGLRDACGATLIGTQTYGKGRAQQHILLEDDSAIVLTTMQLLSLTEGDYHGVGLTPDVEVTNTIARADDALVVPDTVALAPYSCSDNGEALNRALVALGLLEQLPEKPYRLGDETLAALDQLRAYYGLPAAKGADVPTLQLVNYLLDLSGEGRYLRDDQLAHALSLAAETRK